MDISHIMSIFGIQSLTSINLHDLINIALVCTGIKKGALVKRLTNNIKFKLQSELGLFVVDIKQPESNKLFTFISKDPPGKLETHIDIGKALGYLRPVDINKFNMKHMTLKLHFKHKSLFPIITVQKIPNSISNDTVVKYLERIIKGVESLHFPTDYKPDYFVIEVE